jgi:hypothetical protein
MRGCVDQQPQVSSDTSAERRFHVEVLSRRQTKPNDISAATNTDAMNVSSVEPLEPQG